VQVLHRTVTVWYVSTTDSLRIGCAARVRTTTVLIVTCISGIPGGGYTIPRPRRWLKVSDEIRKALCEKRMMIPGHTKNGQPASQPPVHIIIIIDTPLLLVELAKRRGGQRARVCFPVNNDIMIIGPFRNQRIAREKIFPSIETWVVFVGPQTTSELIILRPKALVSSTFCLS
jgi:hypothetical protein